MIPAILALLQRFNPNMINMAKGLLNKPKMTPEVLKIVQTMAGGGTRLITGVAQKPNTYASKEAVELLINKIGGEMVRSNIYKNTADAQKALERILIKPNEIGLIRQAPTYPYGK